VQFKGSVRAPGDKDPGVRVVLEIDEYHLEIRRDSELIGRYYLADVEVARDIAERFILFLGDDEMEFLADDALYFAYEGVTAMQTGWLTAQKRKRRHRRAAEDAARRKDGEAPIEADTTVGRPLNVSDSDTIRARRRQASVAAPQPAVPQRQVVKPSAVTETRTDTRKERRQEPVRAQAAPVAEPGPTLKPAAAKTTRKSKIANVPTVSTSVIPAESSDASLVVDGAAETSLAARRRKITADAEPLNAEALGRVRVPEPVSGTGGPARQNEADGSGTVVKRSPVEIAVDPDADIRFAPEGHHPSETSTGLLAKLRRQPKPPNDHVHRFKESGSSVGLVRRVCIECAHVSIGSPD